jgi:hypothetical protein
LGCRYHKSEEFNGFGCEGENKSPQLSWANAPRNKKLSTYFKSHKFNIYGFFLSKY